MNAAAEQRRSAKHSSVSVEHFTPAYIVEPSREVLGHFDLDPASSTFGNAVVKANWYFTREHDGLQPEWQGRVFLNPPGGVLPKPECRTSSSQVRWWVKLCQEYEARRTTSAIFVGFSVEILQAVQATHAFYPLDFPCCVPAKRIRFDVLVDDLIGRLIDEYEKSHYERQQKLEKRIAELEPLRGQRISGDQPTHSNVIVFLPSIDDKARINDQIERFERAFTPIGCVTKGIL